MTSKGTIIRNIQGERYLLTSRRIVELDSEAAAEGEPWSAANIDLREAAKFLPYWEIKITSPNRGYKTRSSATVSFGKVFGFANGVGTHRIGCGRFDFKTFKKILRNAGVKGTQKKAFAAKAGA